MKINLFTKIKQKAELMVKEFPGEVVVLNPEAGELIILNETSAFIWQRLKRRTSVEGIAKSLCKVFKVGLKEAKKDTLSICQQLANQGLIQVLKR